MRLKSGRILGRLALSVLWLWVGAAGGPLAAQEIFWDSPQVLSRQNARFPQVVEGPGGPILLWQERTDNQAGWPFYFISAARYDPQRSEWRVRRNLLGPFQMPGSETPLFSGALDPQGRFVVAVAEEGAGIRVWEAPSFDSPWDSSALVDGPGTLVAPRLLTTPFGLSLIVTAGQEDTFHTLMARRLGVGRWQAFENLSQAAGFTLNFAPAALTRGNDVVVAFQSLDASVRPPTWQLVARWSRDGGRTFGPPSLLTRQEEAGLAATAWDNQRPSLALDGERLMIAWERRRPGQSEPPQAYAAYLDPAGSSLGLAETERLSNGSFTVNQPQLFRYQDTLFALWFDNRSGANQLSALRRDGAFWRPYGLPRLAGTAAFPRPATADGSLHLFWELESAGRSSLVWAGPDRRVDPPALGPSNLATDRAVNTREWTYTFRLPADPAGIRGFNYLWTEDPLEEVPLEAVYAPSQVQRRSPAQEGRWYLRAVVQDGAGNWSAPFTAMALVDLTPPEPVVFDPPARDESGALTANTGSFSWRATSPDTAGYSVRWDYLGSREPAWAGVRLAPLPAFVSQSRPEVSFNNRENGWWGLSVAAIDRAGNLGPASTLVVWMNKFRVSTVLRRLTWSRDDFGELRLELNGAGFLREGRVTRLILDADGREPFDRVITEGFTIVSDTLITWGPVKLPEGQYRVGLVHPVRGRHFAPQILEVDPFGTLKLGDYRPVEPFAWLWSPESRPGWALNHWPYLVLMGLLSLIGLIALGQLIFSLYEHRTWSLAAWTAREERMKQSRAPAGARRKGLGLQGKFTISILLLTTVVVLSLSLTLGFFIINNSQRSLGQALRQRVQVLLDSLTTGARNYLPSANLVELSLLPGQIAAMDEALSATITGPDAQGQGWSTLWASNRSDLAGQFQPGQQSYSDSLDSALAALAEDLNNQARVELEDSFRRWDELNAQAGNLGALSADPGALARLQDELSQVQNRINSTLRRLSETLGSEPVFDPETLSRARDTYTFFKPVLYASRGSVDVVRGVVRVEVSVSTILGEIERARDDLILLTSVIAALAVGLALLGALVLATFTVRPIKKLVRGVELIRDTENKEELKNHVIQVRSRDELAQLADTINSMTQGLVKAAAASKDLTVGKEVQKMFIPLETDNRGRKMTMGHRESPAVEFFGYYEGAKGVSGDYFDWFALDEHTYAMIKCDVAGKGVPAALIMVEVATIFLNYFKDWDAKRPGAKLRPLVTRMNTLLEERGFKGRFAALTIALYDTRSGIATLCNAGDTLVNIYDAAQGAMTRIKLPDAPAAGVFPTDLVEMKGGFPEVKIPLKVGDTLFLYTDGIEEAKRHLRGADWNVQAFKDPADPASLVPEGTDGSISDEELGPERVTAVLEAVFRRQKFHLRKPHYPRGDADLWFDFSGCQGTAREAILGLAAVEKIWRLVPDPRASAQDRVQLDVGIRDFLKAHFPAFSAYFPGEGQAAEFPEYVYYPRLKEDDQYDDLTLMAFRRLK